MSGKSNHTAPYSATDIEKYLKGELSAGEMHDLERAALDDPFLADAIEGLTLHATLEPAAPLEQDLSDLRERLSGRVSENRRKTIFILRPPNLAAAAILLLGIGYSVFFLMTRRIPISKTDHQYARSKSAATVAPAASPTTAARPATTDSATIAYAAPSGRMESLHRKPAEADYKKVANARPAKTPAAPSPVSTTKSEVVAPGSTTSGLVTPAPARRDTQGLAAVAFNKAAAGNGSYANVLANQFVYTGKVLDQQNRPISGASIALRNNNGFMSTVTNQLGEFNFKLPPLADSLSLLTVSSVGYSQQALVLNNFSANGQRDNIIRLSPRTSGLDEVVVVGYGAKRKETKVASPSGNGENLDSTWIQATPVVGRHAYLEYLASSKNKLGLDSTIHGTETVSFVVDRTGTLTLFKIEQSISPAHDAGILRIVMDGPPWLLLKGKMTRAAVTIKF